MRLLLALAATLLAAPVSANEDLALQIDRVAPSLNGGNLTTLGGPETPQALVDGLDGRWFTLKNTVRNWRGTGDADRENLARAIERTCADTWENIVTYTTTSPTTFRVTQQSPEGDDHGTFDMEPVEPAGRVFATTVEDDYIAKVFGIDAASPELAETRALLSAGLEIWRPTPDVLVNLRANQEIEVWGRCPS
ncbi:hypothetical protein DEVEQU_03629 [Devosia equisanguinis]|uniref:Uncharacterized protein n=1 Tax=Devosia equisanguinis TaxID=2490941 RepID=A0A3S4CG29_9HYPH|nr:hypothetical protein [Devosia equisanguinis]VDS06465.1 hypothetical protein DEVEQU_03629 [Devosia equisanguinis]